MKGYCTKTGKTSRLRWKNRVYRAIERNTAEVDHFFVRLVVGKEFALFALFLSLIFVGRSFLMDNARHIINLSLTIILNGFSAVVVNAGGGREA